jgi:hypothetical protein
MSKVHRGMRSTPVYFGEKRDRLVGTPLVEGSRVEEGTGYIHTAIGASQPYHREFHRYNSEDVELTCHAVYQPVNGHHSDLHLHWTLNNRTLTPSSGRCQIVASAHGQSDDKFPMPDEDSLGEQKPVWFKKESLLIRRLNEDDFGTYSCYAAFRDPNGVAHETQQVTTFCDTTWSIITLKTVLSLNIMITHSKYFVGELELTAKRDQSLLQK